jgi:alkylation response protein AidB-like acyl-CoA dehydrogenase
VSAELTELRESARQVLGENGLGADEARIWPLVLELGWLLVAVPEDDGGLGQGLAGACAFYSEFGRSVAAAPYLPAMLAIDAVCAAGRPDRAQWLERLSTRDYVAAPLTDAAVTVSGGRLSGRAAAVPSADRASHVLLCSDNRQWLGLVPLAGVEKVERPTWDTSRRLFDLHLEGPVPEPALVLAEGAAAEALCRRLEVHRDFALAADAVGGAEALLDSTVEYLRTRRQFGRPLALFQALKHRCADLKGLVAGAEALLQDSLARIGDDPAGDAAAQAGRAAKLQACTVYARVAEEALQLHGGIGMTAEHHCHLYLKRALLNEHLGRGGSRYDLDLADALLAAP